jgi:hypothetical protein
MDEQQMLERNAHIPTAEIERDIAETEYEIANMTREMEGFRMVGDRMSQFRADARRVGIAERQRFIEKLHTLLRLREVVLNVPEREAEIATVE